jgi:pyridoxal 5'-phosphate synthase pdxS subunit
MIRTKGEAGTGNVVEAVRHQRTILRQTGWLQSLRPEQFVGAAKELGVPVELCRMVAELGRLPVVNFAAGGIATPADAALMMQLGVDGVFVGSGIFKSEDPGPRARAIVEATTHYQDPDVLAKVSHGLGEPMHGLDIKELGEEGLLQVRGW